MPFGRILIIDDEPAISEVLGAYLASEGYQVLTARDGLEGLRLAHSERPDLIILDIMLPKMDGLDLLRALRRDSEVYVIMLTARTEEMDRIIGLATGADDYVTKPYSPREVVLRVKAALRRLKSDARTAEARDYVDDHLRLSAGSRQVWTDGQEVALTATEFDLLLALVEHAGLVLGRGQLIERIWGHDFFGEERIVDVHLGNLRKKLGEHHQIATVRGVGYRFEGTQP